MHHSFFFSQINPIINIYSTILHYLKSLSVSKTCAFHILLFADRTDMSDDDHS
jgi:hypothetical protein